MNSDQLSNGGDDVLAAISTISDCMKCPSERAQYDQWLTRENGQLMEHWSVNCPDCGYVNTQKHERW
ncbi:hypothetical protein [Massilia sp. YMA4]|uniref:Small CPxCG-related zinc finger protein n=1 Tax=[Empedobacter] haloabium TaxID=592317 RepID=A0ABZ1UTU3_9BURK|nr:hypothetical protein [Massilia sp. YMA4]